MRFHATVVVSFDMMAPANPDLAASALQAQLQFAIPNALRGQFLKVDQAVVTQVNYVGPDPRK